MQNDDDVEMKDNPTVIMIYSDVNEYNLSRSIYYYIKSNNKYFLISPMNALKTFVEVDYDNYPDNYKSKKKNDNYIKYTLNKIKNNEHSFIIVHNLCIDSYGLFNFIDNLENIMPNVQIKFIIVDDKGYNGLSNIPSNIPWGKIKHKSFENDLEKVINFNTRNYTRIKRFNGIKYLLSYEKEWNNLFNLIYHTLLINPSSLVYRTLSNKKEGMIAYPSKFGIESFCVCPKLDKRACLYIMSNSMEFAFKITNNDDIIDLIHNSSASLIGRFGIINKYSVFYVHDFTALKRKGFLTEVIQYCVGETQSFFSCKYFDCFKIDNFIIIFPNILYKENNSIRKIKRQVIEVKCDWEYQWDPTIFKITIDKLKYV